MTIVTTMKSVLLLLKEKQLRELQAAMSETDSVLRLVGFVAADDNDLLQLLLFYCCCCCC